MDTWTHGHLDTWTPGHLDTVASVNSSAENWLGVVPQLIARIYIPTPKIAVLLERLLTRVAVTHPQALVWPVAVAVNTSHEHQQRIAMNVLAGMQTHNSKLVDEARIISQELMRVAITPHELWQEGLEQAAALYKVQNDVPGMLAKLQVGMAICMGTNTRLSVNLPGSS
jgi:FKBP12-rapamycin complex-associated protein